MSRLVFPGRRASAVLLLIPVLAAACRNPALDPPPETAERIVSLVPAVTETLFALGAGDRVVGVSDFDNYPSETLDRPRVGALINPNLERIFELEPDLVITYGTQSALQERLAAAGIRQYPVVTGSIGNVLSTIRALGDEIGAEDAAQRLASDIEDSLEHLRREAPEPRPSVLLVHSRDIGTMGSFYTGGSRSYFDQLIEIAGGRNIFAEVDENAFQPSLEEVLKRGPEVIVELLPSERGGAAAIAQRLEDWKQLGTVPAVRNGRVYVLAGDDLLLVGPRIHRVAERLAEVIRREALTVR